MKFLNLILNNFRNFKSLQVDFAPRVNFFIGQNGQGKTNLVESLYLATQGKSFRYSEVETLVNTGNTTGAISTKIINKNLDFNIQTHFINNKKSFFLNKKKVNSFEIRKRMPIVLFSPESLSVVKESAEYRRNLVDDFLVTIDEGMAFIQHEYKKSLKSRNFLLKKIKEAAVASEKKNDLDVLNSINPIFFNLAKKLTWYRQKAIEEISADLNIAAQNILENSDVDLSVEMLVSGGKIKNWSTQDIDDAINKRAQELKQAEISTGTSLVGPHKHEIRFLFNQQDSRFFCSQGQQRAIILAFKMAQIVYHRKVHGFYPVLMLDDVLSELDSQKRKALIAFLHEIKTQVFMTSTDLALPESFELEESQIFQIKTNKVINDLTDIGRNY